MKAISSSQPFRREGIKDHITAIAITFIIKIAYGTNSCVYIITVAVPITHLKQLL